MIDLRVLVDIVGRADHCMDAGSGSCWRRALRLSGGGAARVGSAPTVVTPRAGGAARRGMAARTLAFLGYYYELRDPTMQRNPARCGKSGNNAVELRFPPKEKGTAPKRYRTMTRQTLNRSHDRDIPFTQGVIRSRGYVVLLIIPWFTPGYRTLRPLRGHLCATPPPAMCIRLELQPRLRAGRTPPITHT